MNRRRFLESAGAAVVVAACASRRPLPEPAMDPSKTFLLLHGSWHGAWCWYKVVRRLERRGHRAVAVDLPAHGRDRAAPGAVTLKDYVDAVTRLIDERPEPVVLVGHSRAGIVVSEVAEARPDRVLRSVYLAAFLIPGGEAMLPTALGDEESLIAKNLVVDEVAGTHMLRREAFRDALYHDCSDEDVALASLLLTPEPNLPVATPLALTAERFGRVPRTYIECTQDRGISPSLQRAMQARVGVERVVQMATSHSPFLSAPDELVEHLRFGAR